jgi:nucleotide-binding universal stress UspA family protein
LRSPGQEEGSAVSTLMNILAPVDFSRISRMALRQAAGMGDGKRVQVDVLHVLQPFAFRGEANPLIGEFAQASVTRGLDQLIAGLHQRDRARLHRVIEFGDPAEIILNRAARDSYDLIVLGSRRPTPGAPWGEVVRRVLEQAPCPVVVVRGPWGTSWELSGPLAWRPLARAAAAVAQSAPADNELRWLG